MMPLKKVKNSWQQHRDKPFYARAGLPLTVDMR